MKRDDERIERMVQAMREARLDALLCALPSNVLMLTGYWPVVGTSIAIVTVEGEVTLLAPEDEKSFSERAMADRLITLHAGSLDRVSTLSEDISGELLEVIETLGLRGRTVGIETTAVSEQASYVAMNFYGATLQDILGQTCTLVSADDLFWRERGILTEVEISRLRLSCAIAAQAYRAGASYLRNELTELEAAQYFQTSLSIFQIAADSIQRADGRVACMSGIRSGSAYGSYALSTTATIAADDLVLTHCNSQADGYWTDITRTYHIGAPDSRVTAMYEASFAARQVAIEAVRPGVKAADIDRAARDVLRQRGFGDQYKHGTGHGVGFRAIDHRAFPRIRPDSPDTLEAGMVFNIEPAIYFEDFGGMRHCDMVLVTPTGCELLTPFHSAIEELVVQ